MMKKVRGMGRGFFILSALLLMFAAVGCDDSDTTERIVSDTDEAVVTPGVNVRTFDVPAAGMNISVGAADGNADATVRAFIDSAGGATVTVQTGDYDTAFIDEFDELFDEDAGDGNRWQVAGFARISTNNAVTLSNILLTMPDSAVVGGRTLSDWVTAGQKPTVRVYDAQTDAWTTVNLNDYTLVQNNDGTVTISYTGLPITVGDGDAVAVMDPITDVDVDLNASNPDDNCDVTVTADVDDSNYDVTGAMWWADWAFDVVDDDSIRLDGVVSVDERAPVHVRANVAYASGADSGLQTVERVFGIRCETGSGGVTQ